MTGRKGWAAAVASATLLFASAARAQIRGPIWSDRGIAADRFEPAPPGDTFFGVPSPFVSGQATPRASLTFDYAHRPLLLSDGRAILAGQGFVHAGFSFAIVDRILLSFDLPVVLFQSGDRPTSQEITYALPDSPVPEGGAFRPALGDLRLGARVRVFGEEVGLFQAALGFYLHIPSFMKSSILREPSVRASPHLILGGRYRYLVWTATLGTVLRGPDTPSTLTYGAGVAALLGHDRLTLGAEIHAITPLRSGELSVNFTKALELPASTGAELLFDARVRAGSMVFGAAVGPGFGGAPGTPAFRALGSLAFSPLPPTPPAPASPDTDEDGIFDAEDGCPYAFGLASSNPKRNGCPARDRDGDGVPDEDDRCPERAGPKEKGGCPPDRDGDGASDDMDLCPDVKGTAETGGCPDEDGDGVPDAEDACPKEKGSWHVDSKRNGCPAAPEAGEATKQP